MLSDFTYKKDLADLSRKNIRSWTLAASLLYTGFDLWEGEYMASKRGQDNGGPSTVCDGQN